MMSCTMGTVLTVTIRLRMMSRSRARSPLVSSIMLLLGWLWSWHIIELSVCCFKNYFASTTELFCNNFIWTLMCVKLCFVMNGCNLWWRCLTMYGLGCMLVESRSFEILSDYRVYMSSSPLVWLLSWSLIHFHSCRVPQSRHSSKKFVFFKKNSLPSATARH